MSLSVTVVGVGRLNPLSWAERLICFNNPWLGYIVTFSNEVKLNLRGGVGFMAFSPLCRFAPWLFRPLARSPPGLFAPWLIRTRTLDDSSPGLFAPWLVRPLACSPPGWFAHAPWTIRPLACSPPYVVSLMYHYQWRREGFCRPGQTSVAAPSSQGWGVGRLWLQTSKGPFVACRPALFYSAPYHVQIVSGNSNVAYGHKTFMIMISGGGKRGRRGACAPGGTSPSPIQSIGRGTPSTHPIPD